MPGGLKQQTCPTSFAVQLEDGRLLRRHHHHLIPRSRVIQETIADEVPPPPAAEQPELQLEEPVRQPTEPVQSAPQDIPERRYPTKNRQVPRYLADFVTKLLVML